MTFDRLLAWLRSRQRALATGIALLSFGVALLSTTVSVFQAGMLYSQRSTPYQTALYVRQLQVAGDFAGAAHEQWLSIINLHNDCVDRYNGNVPDGDYKGIAIDFRSGSVALHKAYAGALLTFPNDAHEDAAKIWDINEDLFDHVVAPSADCMSFLNHWRDTGANDKVDQMNQLTRDLVDQLRDKLGVGQLSWPRTIEEMRHSTPDTAKPAANAP